MIITCGKCDTSYELNENLVKEKGSKVRCKTCGNVFTVFPPSVLSAIEPEPEPEFELEAVSDDTGFSKGPLPGSESLDIASIEKMLESQKVLGPDSIKITEEEPELSLSDMDVKPRPLKNDLSDDLDFLDLSDIEKMLDTEVEQDPGSVKITEMEPELTLAMESGSDLLKPSVDEGDSLDLSDIEKILDTDVNEGPDSVKITEGEPELSLEMDFRETQEHSLDKQEETLELDLDLDEEIRFDEDLDQDLKLEMEGETDSEFELEMESGDESELKLEMEAESDSDLELSLDLDLDLDLDEYAESESEDGEAELFINNTEKQDVPIPNPAEKPAGDEFELDLEEPDQAYKAQKKADEFVIQGKQTAKSVEFAMAADPAAKKKAGKQPVYGNGRPGPGKKSNALTYVLMTLLILTGGAFGVMKYGEQLGLKLPSMDAFMPEKGKMVVIESSLKNNFIDNAKIGSLLVITGNIQNNFNKERSHVQVSVDVLGMDKTLIKSDVVYCGNIVKNQSLMNDDMSTVKRFLMKPDGESMTNVNIKPGGMVPFMVVFSDLPGSVKEFQVKVASSEPAKK